MPLPIRILYIEELNPTMRGRFAWLGAAVVLLAVGGLATIPDVFEERLIELLTHQT